MLCPIIMAIGIVQMVQALFAYMFSDDRRTPSMYMISAAIFFVAAALFRLAEVAT